MILFLCTGNTCRSPMAAALYNTLHGEQAESAGLAAQPGDAAATNAQLAVRDYGADLSRHAARLLTPELLAGARLVFTMTLSQARRLQAQYPAYAEKITPLSQGEDIMDPYGGPLSLYRQTAARLYELIKKLNP